MAGASLGKLTAWLSRPDVQIPVALAIIVFAIEAALGFRLHAIGVFTTYDVLFDADPVVGLSVFSHGYVDPAVKFADWDIEVAPGLKHPHLATFIFPVVWLLAQIVALASLGAIDPSTARYVVALLVAPAFSAVKAPLFYALFRLLNIERFAAACLTVVGVGCFSNLLFGAIPEHWVIGSASLLALLIQSALALRSERYDRLWIWALYGVAVMSVTSTNIVMFAIAMFATRVLKAAPFHRAMLTTGGLSSLIAVGVVVSAYAMEAITPYVTGVGGAGGVVDAHLRLDPVEFVRAALHYPIMLWYTLWPGLPDYYQSGYFTAADAEVTTQFRFLYGLFTPANLGAALVMIGASAGGLYFAWMRGEAHRLVAIVCAGMLAFNGALHALWGSTWFIYAMHWQPALVAALSGWAVCAHLGPRSRAALFAFAALMCCLASWRVFGALFEVLALGDLGHHARPDA